MTSIEAIAGVIQLAVASVFLLAGIAGLLGVLVIRLGRIIDQASRNGDGCRESLVRA